MFLVYSYFDGSLIQVDGKEWEWGMEELQRGLFTSPLHSYMFAIGVFLVAIIPLIGLIMLGSRLLFRYQMKNRGFFPVMFSLWLIGLVTLIISGIGLGKEFARDEGFSDFDKIELQGDVLYIDVKQDSHFSHAIRWRHNRFPTELVELENDTVFCGFPELRIKQQLGKDYVELEIEKESHGYTSEAAFERAGKITYIYQIHGDTILFDPYFSYALDDKMRDQQCDLTLRIPAGQQVFFGERIPRILEDARNRHAVDIEDMTEKMWIMTDEGLRSLDEEEEPESEELESELTAFVPAQLKFVPSNPLFALDVKYGDSELRK